MTVSNYVFVYNGVGTNPACVTETTQRLKILYGGSQVVLLDGSYLEREAAPSLYVFPAGVAEWYPVGLDIAAKKICSSVHSNGSGVLGFGTGGLFASSSWEYGILNENPQLERSYVLNLGPIARGPAIYSGSGDVVSCMVPIYLPEQEKVMRCFWSKGPGFPDVKEGMNVVAEYQSSINPAIKKTIKETLPAVVAVPSGKGNVVLSGVHPELARWANAHGHPLSEEEIKANDELFKTCCTLAGALNPSQ